MDQKHAMLYPDPNAIAASDHRTSAAAAIGLPIEAPPSYDIAMGGSGSSTSYTPNTNTQVNHGPMGWSSNVPANSQPAMEINQNFPVIVDQPKSISNIQYPDESNTHYQSPNPTNDHQANMQPQQQDGSVAITTQPTQANLNLGPNPSTVVCPACGACKTSRMHYTPNTKTHISAFVLFFVGWCCCACLVPYCMNSCRTGNHYCSSCNAFLGTYSPPSRPRAPRPPRPGRPHRHRSPRRERDSDK